MRDEFDKTAWSIPYTVQGKSDGESVTVYMDDGSYIEGVYHAPKRDKP